MTSSNSARVFAIRSNARSAILGQEFVAICKCAVCPCVKHRYVLHLVSVRITIRVPPVRVPLARAVRTAYRIPRYAYRRYVHPPKAGCQWVLFSLSVPCALACVKGGMHSHTETHTNHTKQLETMKQRHVRDFTLRVLQVPSRALHQMTQSESRGLRGQRHWQCE